MNKGRIAPFIAGVLVLFGLGRLIGKRPSEQAMQNSEQQKAVAAPVAEHDAVDHEYRDASPWGIAMVGLGVVAMLVVTYLAVWGLFAYFDARQARADVPPPLLATTPQPPPEPRLQVVPPRELREVVSSEEELLDSYGWVDPNTNTVRIPIERAMELLAERGLPAREAQADFGRDEAHELESEGGQPAEATAEPAP